MNDPRLLEEVWVDAVGETACLVESVIDVAYFVGDGIEFMLAVTEDRGADGQ